MRFRAFITSLAVFSISDQVSSVRLTEEFAKPLDFAENETAADLWLEKKTTDAEK